HHGDHPDGAHGDKQATQDIGEHNLNLLLKEECLRPRCCRGHAIRTVVLPPRVIPHIVTHNAHALRCRGESHGTDGPLFLHSDAPDLLAELATLSLRHTECLLPQLHELLHGC